MSDTPGSVRERAEKLRNNGDPWEVPRMLERYAELMEYVGIIEPEHTELQVLVTARDAEIAELKARLETTEHQVDVLQKAVLRMSGAKRAEAYVPDIPLNDQPLVTEGWAVTDGVVTKRGGSGDED